MVTVKSLRALCIFWKLEMYRKFLIALMSETMIDVQVSRKDPEMSSSIM